MGNNRVQVGFVARFAAVLLAVTVGISAGLSYLFAGRHLEAIRADLIATAAGQASATLEPVLQRAASSGKLSAAGAERLGAAIHNVENFSEYVRDVRIYRPDGRALEPANSPPAATMVRSAISDQNLVQSAPREVSGDRLVTVFAPIASSERPGYLAVAAIDVSVGQIEAQTGRESQFVVFVTVAALAVVFMSLLTLAIAAQRELNRRRLAAETTFLQTMEGIATIVDQRDPYTAGHSHRVSEYSASIARAMKLRGELVDRVRWAALLHDLGKIGIADAVLLKEGPLDDRERTAINRHPSIAHEILSPVEAMSDIAPCVLHHHERWDGAGYPAGLRGEAIPLLSRIIAVADTFDAMTTDRPYRVALTLDEARARLAAGRNVQWDERCVDVLLALLDDRSICPATVKPPAIFGRRVAN